MGSQNMDDATQDYWQRYIEEVQRHLKLSDWDVTLARNEPDDSSLGACIGIFYGQRRAEIQINLKTFLAMTPFHKKVTIVHELIHLHFDRRKTFTRKFCETMEEKQGAFFWEVYYESFEDEVELMANIISPYMPDPEVIIGDPPLNTSGY